MAPEIVHQTATAAQEARTRIKNHIYCTPLIPAQKVGKPNQAKILFKCENFQLTGSFKLRGAMSKISAQEPGKRLITASSGNHGIGSACASAALGQDLTVVLPESVVLSKLKKIRGYGVNVVLHGAETGLAEKYAQRMAKEEGYVYVSPYNDPLIVAGQGTIGIEILEQCGTERVDNVFVSMGGGGLISGIGSVIKARSPGTKVFGIAARNSMALAASMEAGKVVETEHLDTLAEAVAGGMDEDSITLPIAMAVVDEVIVCDEQDIKEAIREMAWSENMVVEGSAALALAGMNKVLDQVGGQTSVVVLCGANYDENTIRKIIC